MLNKNWPSSISFKDAVNHCRICCSVQPVRTVLGLVKENEIRFVSIFLVFDLGTGKTRTLCAAIEEIVRSTGKSVLVCANSNSACDEIAARLVDVLHDGEMFRMYGKSYDIRKVSEKIKPICNWMKGEFRFPSLTFLYGFRVLVCTLTTAGCLTRAIDSSMFNAKHFSHIIIDESASTHETVTLIPIAGEFISYNFQKKKKKFSRNWSFYLLRLRNHDFQNEQKVHEKN